MKPLKTLQTIIASLGLAACLAGCPSDYEFDNFEGYLEGEKISFSKKGTCGCTYEMAVIKNDSTIATYSIRGGEVYKFTLDKEKLSCPENADTARREVIEYTEKDKEFIGPINTEFNAYIKKIREYRKSQMDNHLGREKIK
jgi:hypothetical protein